MMCNVFWVSKNQNSMEKIGQNFHISFRSGPRWLTPPDPDREISKITRLTYNCAHLRSTKVSPTVEFGTG